ncbi:MAG: ABC transporter ATP-binding protein [bacterium]
MVIEVKNLSFGYGEKKVLKDINLYIPSGKFVAILGRNGSGKSTLLKLMAGMFDLEKGWIYINGHDLKSLKRTQIARLIGYLPQFHTSFFPFTVEEVVLTGRASFVFSVPNRHDREIVEKVMKIVGIEEIRGRRYTELSGGERQLVMFTRVLAQEPKIVLMDEPLSHLDLHNQVKILNLIKELTAKGLTVVAVLHDPNTAFRFADEFIFLKNGSIFRIDSDKKLWDQSVLSEVYDAPLEVIPYKGRALVMPI